MECFYARRTLWFGRVEPRLPDIVGELRQAAKRDIVIKAACDRADLAPLDADAGPPG